MNNIFDIRRFGKYLATDMRRIAADQWLSLTVISLLGVILYLTLTLWNGIFFLERSFVDIEARAIMFTIACILICADIPVKCYGHVTDGRKGGAFMLTPASSFEKWLSMILVCIIIVPTLFLAVYLGTDSLLCTMDSNCGESLISSMSGSGAADDGGNGYGMSLLWLYIITAMAFLSGALWFRRHKKTKTVLCIVAFWIAVGIVAGSTIIPAITEIETPGLSLSDPRVTEILHRARIAETVTEILLLTGLTAATYFRIRTIKY